MRLWKSPLVGFVERRLTKAPLSIILSIIMVDTIERDEEIIRMWNKERSLRKVAKFFNLSHQRIHQIVVKWKKETV